MILRCANVPLEIRRQGAVGKFEFCIPNGSRDTWQGGGNRLLSDVVESIVAILENVSVAAAAAAVHVCTTRSERQWTDILASRMYCS